MNLIYYCFFSVIISWTDAAFIHFFPHVSSKWSLNRHRSSFDVSNDFENEMTTTTTTSEPVLSRRRPQLNWLGRRKRWSFDDEVEIPIEQNNIPWLDSATLPTTVESKQPLLRQDTIEINETEELTTISNNDTFVESTTSIATSQDTAIVLLDFTTVQPVTLEENLASTVELISSNESEFTTIEYNTTSIAEEIENSTQIYTKSTEITTNVVDIVQNSTESVELEIDNTTNDVATNETIDFTTTIISDITQNATKMSEDATIVSDNSTTLSETTEIIYEDNEYANETAPEQPKILPKPVCDESCQCTQKCPYGYEMINGTCECEPPCKNSQCFGNDTCVVSKSGQPECYPTNGTVHDRPFRCYQPRDPGYHDADIRYYDRWYYNADRDACHLLVYRGLGGNTNNFQTLHECTLECITCGPAPDKGSCLGFMHMWHYNHTTNQCSQFEYSGCKGNENKFIRKQDCVDTCVTRILNL